MILGFFVLAMVMVAGAIVAGQAFVQQRDLQDVCDGAAAAAAAAAADLSRASGGRWDGSLQFSGLDNAVEQYLGRDPGLRGVQVNAALSPDARTIRLRCMRRSPIAFGALFGKAEGITHVVESSAREPVL